MSFDNELKFDKKINTVVKKSFYHFRSIAGLKKFLMVEDLEIVIHAFVTLRIDYSKSLYFVCVNLLYHVCNWFKMPRPGSLPMKKRRSIFYRFLSHFNGC